MKHMNDDALQASKKLWRLNWNKYHIQIDFEHAIDLNDNGRDYDGIG